MSALYRNRIISVICGLALTSIMGAINITVPKSGAGRIVKIIGKYLSPDGFAQRSAREGNG